MGHGDQLRPEDLESQSNEEALREQMNLANRIVAAVTGALPEGQPVPYEVMRCLGALLKSVLDQTKK